MSIIEIKNQLISHFYDNDSFDLLDDVDKIRLDDKLLIVKQQVVSSVLAELETMGMIKKVSEGERTVWLLTQSFDTFNQSVVLSAASSEIIADTINSFRDANEISGDICDKTRINESDILNLVNICHVLLEGETKTDDEFDEIE